MFSLSEDRPGATVATDTEAAEDRMSWLCRLFGHVDHRERDDEGRYTWRCQKCGNVRIILAGQEFRGRSVQESRVLNTQPDWSRLYRKTPHE